MLYNNANYLRVPACLVSLVSATEETLAQLGVVSVARGGNTGGANIFLKIFKIIKSQKRGQKRIRLLLM